MNLSYRWDGQSFNIQYLSWQKHLLNANLYMAEGSAAAIPSLSLSVCVYVTVCGCRDNMYDYKIWKVKEVGDSPQTISCPSSGTLFTFPWCLRLFPGPPAGVILEWTAAPNENEGKMFAGLWILHWQVQWLPRMYLHGAGNIYMMLKLHSCGEEIVYSNEHWEGWFDFLIQPETMWWLGRK